MPHIAEAFSFILNELYKFGATTIESNFSVNQYIIQIILIQS